MRTMDFGQDLILDSAGQLYWVEPTWLGLKIWAYVAWPEDQARRHSFLAAQVAYQILQLDASNSNRDDAFAPEPEVFVRWPPTARNDPDDSVRAARLDVLNRRFEATDGGLRPLLCATLNDRLDHEFVKAWRNAMLAAQRFGLTWAMALGHCETVKRPSLGKARTTLLAWLKSEEMSTNRESNDLAWSNYKNVVPVVLAASVVASQNEARFGDAVDVTEKPCALRHVIRSSPLRVLAVADKLMNFGLDFVEKGSRPAILDAKTVWRVPYVHALPSANLPDVTLPPQLLDVAKNYRARNRQV
ncbi:MAG: hypothetical protein ACR2PI_08185 [Hyphomicrobiaceae bacterium]